MLFPDDQNIGDLPPFLDDPTSIVVSVSGGLDSDRTALLLRERYPDRRLILWHAFLDRMDWPETSGHLDRLAKFLGNVERVTVQSVFELTGGTTPTGFQSTRLRRIQDVTNFGPATDNDPAAITNLLDFAELARNGMPPTKKLRYCTAYFKTGLFDAWLIRNRVRLGERCLIATGERWAESPDRSKLKSWEWRGAISPSKQFPLGWRALWIRPVIEMKAHEVATSVISTGLSPHPGYFAQGATLETLQDRYTAERGRPRLSCVCCIFTRDTHLQTALRQAPDSVGPVYQQIRSFETRTGKTWKQSGSGVEATVPSKRSLPLFEE